MNYSYVGMGVPVRSARMTSAERTREALIRAGLRLFGRQGFDATSTRALAAEAGANIGSIAYHFGSKEGLRTACAQYIVDKVSELADRTLGDLASEAAGTSSSEEARALLIQALQAMVGFTVARPEAGDMVQFLLRELSYPTGALDVIIAGVFDPMHKRLCALWAAATGEPADSERTKITVFTIVGQVLYFRIAQVPVMRRLGWTAIGPREAASVADVIAANLASILDARKTKT